MENKAHLNAPQNETDNLLATLRFHQGSGATSAEAKVTEEYIRHFEIHLAESATGLRLKQIKRKINEIWSEAECEGWDGEGSFVVSNCTRTSAIKFIESLPLMQQGEPEVTATARGGIAFDWVNESDESLTVIILENEIIHSALFADGRDRGTKKFKSDVPAAVLEALEKIFPKAE